MSWRIAADVGGTFTDLVAASDAGRYVHLKLPSTPAAFEEAVAAGLDGVLEKANVRGEDVERFLHGTTVATNAVIERSGPAVGLITTEGFRDVLEIGRLRIPNSYDLFWTKPVPLARRRHRLEVRERTAADGTVLSEPELDALAPRVDRATRDGVTSFAVSLLNSYVNPQNERAVGRWLAERFPELTVTLGVDVVRELGEYERTSTAVLNAYLKPVVSQYLRRLVSSVEQRAPRAVVLIMQSSGGMMPIPEARENPVHILESGPAAGALAASRSASALSLKKAISFDMGGTTVKASLIEDFEVAYCSEFSVGSDISAMSRLLRGGGYAVRLPAIDLAEVGAGGGSIAHLDTGGLLTVGPESAGSAPGPACYARGGLRPTVTDANLLLGYLSPRGLAAAGISIDVDRARRAIESDIAKPLRIGVFEAAAAIHAVADQRMARAIRSVSTERGRDPREHALIAFGGSGPLHAASLAEAVGIRVVVVPPLAGVFSATGLLASPVHLTATETVAEPLDDVALTAAMRLLDRLDGSLRARLRATGFSADVVRSARSLELRYVGQAYELSVNVGDTAPNARSLAATFIELHRATYGHGDDVRIEIVSARVTVAVAEAALPQVSLPASEAPGHRTRRAWFHGGRIDVPVLRRADCGAGVRGPCLVDDPDTTVVVPPGWKAALRSADLVLEALA